MKTTNLKTTIFSLIIVSFVACTKSDDTTTETGETTNDNTEVVIEDTDFEPTDWTTETHSKDADPNFSEVFDDTKVKRFDFVISEDNWAAMLNDMTATYGAFGSGNSSGGPGGGGLVTSDEDPIFVPAEVFYNGTQWYKVGLRFKGNSSLQSA